MIQANLFLGNSQLIVLLPFSNEQNRYCDIPTTTVCVCMLGMARSRRCAIYKYEYQYIRNCTRRTRKKGHACCMRFDIFSWAGLAIKTLHKFLLMSDDSLHTRSYIITFCIITGFKLHIVYTIEVRRYCSRPTWGPATSTLPAAMTPSAMYH